MVVKRALWMRAPVLKGTVFRNRKQAMAMSIETRAAAELDVFAACYRVCPVTVS
jgi:hypothetical protein